MSADQRDAAFLGLVVLAFGLVVAPLLHRAAHHHDHHHGPVSPVDSSHGRGALEHQLASFTAPPQAAGPVFFAVAVAVPEPRVERAVALAPRWRDEQPQGP